MWLLDQLTILAVAFGATDITSGRLRIYAEDLLSVLYPQQIEPALTRARRELKWFPKIAELLELAGAGPEERRSVEADTAWKFANDYLRQWGADPLPVYSGGNFVQAPRLPSRIDFALRRIGGLRGLNQVTTQSRPFIYKDFCEAYNQAPIAEQHAPQLQKFFGKHKLLGRMKCLTGTTDAIKRVPLEEKKTESGF